MAKRKTITIQGITFQVESQHNYFWYGVENDVCLESTDGGTNWHIWCHDKDGAVSQHITRPNRDQLVILAKQGLWFEKPETTDGGK